LERPGVTLVAIHQPNFFPWLGFFDKLARADRFVVLDNVQYARSGSGNWGNRVKLLVAGEARWVTAPVDRSTSGLQAIRDMHFDSSGLWREKMLRTIDSNYRRAAHYAEARALLEPLILHPENKLADYNLNMIRRISEALGLDTGKILLASKLGGIGAGTDLLISLTKAAEGNAYLAGGGAGGYQEDALFQDAGLELRYQAFEHPVYPQHGSGDAFIPGLSVIDALMNVGVDGVRRLLDVRALAGH
jgi:hypothetical protein